MKKKIKKIAQKMARWIFNNLPYLAISGIISLVLSEIVRIKILPKLQYSMVIDYFNRKPTISLAELFVFVLVSICIMLSPMAITRKVENLEIIISTSLVIFISLELPITLLLSISSSRLSAYFIFGTWIIICCLLLLFKALFFEIKKWFLNTKENKELNLNKLIFLWGIITVLIGWLLKN